MHRPLAIVVALATVFASALPSQTPFTGATEQGVPFPLPQAHDQNGRRYGSTGNALTITWDGKLMMYQDMGLPLWNGRPAGTQGHGYVFATFDPSRVASVGGRPDFSACIGTPFPRFAHVLETTPPTPGVPGANTYPGFPGRPDGYPYLDNPNGLGGAGPGSMGELGLRDGYDFLSNILYPIPPDELPAAAAGANPFPSDTKGRPASDGTQRTYHVECTFQDQVRFWNGTRWSGLHSQDQTQYEGGSPAVVYPNGQQRTVTAWLVKRNGSARLAIVVDPLAQQVLRVDVLRKWRPFQVVGDGTWGTSQNATVGVSVPTTTTMWADTFEPSLSNDGHLMIGKGVPNLVNGHGPGGNHYHSQILFFYNTRPFAETGWQGPWPLHHIYEHRNVLLAGRTIGERYPLARERLKSFDGSLFGDRDGDGTVTRTERDQMSYEGGYCWLSPDGRYVIHSLTTGGVGYHRTSQPTYAHPQMVRPFDDGGGSSNRAHTTLIGSVTGWQQWRIDHAAENPSRHYYTAWDFNSRTTHVRNASFGFSPGFWQMLRGAQGIPMHDDGSTKLHLVNSNRLLYYELDLSPYQERDYGFYLPMTEMLVLNQSGIGVNYWEEREVDIGRTPDLSGHGNVGVLRGAMLPCEYFELPTRTNNFLHTPGLAVRAASPAAIHPLWTANDTVTDQANYHWARLADGPIGIPTKVTGQPLPYGPPWTSPFAGRGNKHDMDSDTLWGRVGQAMFFKNSAHVRIDNDGSKPELNPGTAANRESSGLTASFWIHPMQARSGPVVVYRHGFEIELDAAGGLVARVTDDNGVQAQLRSAPGAVPQNVWTHVALVWRELQGSASEAMLYGNGRLLAGPLALSSGRLLLSQAPIEVGCLGSVAGRPNEAVFLLDEVALKGSALEPEDVAAMALVPVPVPQWNTSNLPQPPVGLANADARVPTDNPYSAAAAELGADLFFDVQLSGSKTMSCATCHEPEQAFTDGRTVGRGPLGDLLRNTPTLHNQRFQIAQLWDGRAEDLEAQALMPVFNPHEMATTWAALDAYLENDPDYDARFQAVFNATDIQPVHVEKALASYQRSLVAADSDVDRAQLGTAEQRGKILFEGKARCIGCHRGPTFSDGRLWSTGSHRADGHDDGASRLDAGRRTAGRARFRGAFKTPTLRDLALTAPYFHDGHAATLAEVIDFYDAGGVRTDGLGFDLDDAEHHVAAEEINRELGLRVGEKADLEAYLLALTSRTTMAATGTNLRPTVVNVATTTGPGGPQVQFDVVDTDAGDVVTTMAWTLRVVVLGTGQQFDWAHAQVAHTPIPGGRHVTVTLPAGSYPSGTITLQAADHHGLWSFVANN